MSASTPNTGAEPAVHVVSGIVARGGMIFLTRRSERTHLAGTWEFPGGKLEPDEDAFDGLRREPQEEIGIELLDAQPMYAFPAGIPNKPFFWTSGALRHFAASRMGVKGNPLAGHDPTICLCPTFRQRIAQCCADCSCRRFTSSLIPHSTVRNDSALI